jgi:hypothetical protein
MVDATGWGDCSHVRKTFSRNLGRILGQQRISDIYKALLNVDGKFESIAAYLSASASETIKNLMDQGDSRGRTV